MPDWLVLMGMGGVFILLGIGAFVWGRNEEKGYYDSTASRTDAREFLNHWPPRPSLGAPKIGGRIAIAVGFILLIIGIIVLLAERAS